MEVLKVENLSKKYRLGVFGVDSLREDIANFFRKRKQIRSDASETRIDEFGYFDALKNISFSINQGEVLGIIGHNGAGKSTLLKILSQITSPTEGEIRIRGRVASLLEVGTGFHPELTGRENIFLNGTILGMTKKEVSISFDEIVEFSGIEHHIDTPVKRYSSGMKVRLGFAVAAHLKPEILVIDEVLAVGDAEFQKKCIGKMKDVSAEGRTVIFVSHNMTAVRSLCPRTILLDGGRLSYEGNTDGAIASYLGKTGGNNIFISNGDRIIGSESFRISKILASAQFKNADDPITMEDSIAVQIDALQSDRENQYDITLQIKGEEGNVLFASGSGDFNVKKSSNEKREFKVKFPGNFFNSGNFEVNVLVVKNRQEVTYFGESLIGFSVISDIKQSGQWLGRAKGDLKPNFVWEIN